MNSADHAKKLINEGKLKEALPLLEKLTTGSTRFWALKMVGMIHCETGNLDKSASCLTAALSISPDDIEANYYMGVVCNERGAGDDAIPYLQKILQQKNNNYQALNLLSLILLHKKRNQEALELTRIMSATWPDDTESNFLHGQVLVEVGKATEAIHCFDKVIASNPERYEGYSCKAGALQALGRINEAIDCYRQACRFSGAEVTPALELSALYEQIRRPHDALSLNQGMLIQFPDNTKVLNRVASFYIKLYKSQKAIELLNRSIALDDHQVDAYLALADAYKSSGLLDKCIDHLRKWLILAGSEKKPEQYSNYLMNLNYFPAITNKQLFAEHRKWDEYFFRKENQFNHKGHNTSADRKLRIGYISADFNNHAVYYFIEPIFANHDKKNFELFGYYNNLICDQVTERFKEYTNVWRNIHGLADDEASQLIYDDSIDILIDLSGHTAGNRLPVITMKPAPVQIEYEAYPNTTGLDSIDYKLTDRFLDKESDQQWHSETLYSLGECFICYQPNADAPGITEPPVSMNEYITFGSFSNLYKINKGVIELWSKLLHRVPDSRLVICRLSINDEAIAYFKKLFKQQGIDCDRIEFIGSIPPRYSSLPDGTGCMALMSECDLILDTFPYCNHTIACESLWMGVPVITLYGDRHASRVCATILNAIGHNELIAYSKDEYISLAVELASSPTRVVQLRQTLRASFESSMLMDFSSFTCRLEAVYRKLWRAYCRQ